MTNFLNLFCLKMSLFLLLLKDNFSGYKIWCVTFFSPEALSSSAFMFVQFQKSCPMSFVSLFLMRRDFPFSLPSSFFQHFLFVSVSLLLEGSILVDFLFIIYFLCILGASWICGSVSVTS